MVALIGDVGGTNIRLTLRRLNMQTRTSTEIKELTKIRSQEASTICAAIEQFLQEFQRGSDDWPSVGCVGIAGEVNNNKVDLTANAMHWGMTDGNQIAQELGIEQFLLVNDFVAAGQ